MKYPIKKEFFPFNRFKPPINERFLRVAVPHMKTPKFIYKDKALSTREYEVQTQDNAKIQCLLFSPKGIEDNAPCLVYIHGGGFVLPAAGYHYKNAMRYAKDARCVVWFINYRLAPNYKYPTPFEDCYAATCWLFDNAKTLGIDERKMAIGGDSAGATLATAVCMMAKDRAHPVNFTAQMLVYPFLDMRGKSKSNEIYTDTPMWNATLSARIEPMIKVDKTDASYKYFSPVEAENFDGLPPAYIETAEFDCLHDDGILYAELLQKAGVSVTLYETEGTMHGFDIVQRAPTTKQALEKRVAFLNEKLHG